MAVLGIVAEYNPFHNGHLYLIEKAKQEQNFTAAIVVMSGNFLQRGEPSFCNKWARAEMAIHGGADLVIELPFCFAARSAYYFARGAIQILYRTGVVTHLAFGSESGDLSLLQQIATVLAQEPKSFQKALKDNLSQGLSFPLARARALQSYIKDDQQLHETLLGSNNILALEYLRVIEEERIPLIPLTITRQGFSYHSTDLSHYSSATAIRSALQNGLSLDDIASTMPRASVDILQREMLQGRSPVWPDALEQAILVKLRTISAEYLQDIYEISEGLEHRIKEAANSSTTLGELRQSIKSKRYSLTRINRTLLYSLFALSKNKVSLFDQHGPLYLHILAFSAKGQEILQEMKNKSKVKIISRGSEMKRTRDKDPMSVLGAMISLDIKAGDVYSLLFPSPAARRGGQDFTTSPKMIN